MKITRRQLRQLIKEELSILSESERRLRAGTRLAGRLVKAMGAGLLSGFDGTDEGEVRAVFDEIDRSPEPEELFDVIRDQYRKLAKSSLEHDLREELDSDDQSYILRKAPFLDL